MHATQTLRKAGLQLRRKMRAVADAMASDPDFSRSLGFSSADGMPAMAGWIVDTSVEFDHQRFSGFLKVSLDWEPECPSFDGVEQDQNHGHDFRFPKIIISDVHVERNHSSRGDEFV